MAGVPYSIDADLLEMVHQAMEMIDANMNLNQCNHEKETLYYSACIWSLCILFSFLNLDHATLVKQIVWFELKRLASYICSFREICVIYLDFTPLSSQA